MLYLLSTDSGNITVADTSTSIKLFLHRCKIWEFEQSRIQFTKIIDQIKVMLVVQSLIGDDDLIQNTELQQIDQRCCIVCARELLYDTM